MLPARGIPSLSTDCLCSLLKRRDGLLGCISDNFWKTLNSQLAEAGCRVTRATCVRTSSQVPPGNTPQQGSPRCPLPGPWDGEARGGRVRMHLCGQFGWLPIPRE